MAKKEDFEYVLLEDVPLIKSNFDSISEELKSSIDKAMKHVNILKDKHDCVTIAQSQANEIQKLIRKLDGFFVKEVVHHEERPIVTPKKEVFVTREEKEFTATSQQALRNIQHNLEELKKHLSLL